MKKNSSYKTNFNTRNKKLRRNFSFSIKPSKILLSDNGGNNNRNNNINDIFKFINTGKIYPFSNTQNIITSPNNAKNGLILDKSEIAIARMKKQNSFYNNKNSSSSCFFSFDKKNNNYDDFFENSKLLSKKKKYVYEHYNKVFNNKENEKTSYNSKVNKQEEIMKTIDKFKKNYFQYKKKSFIDNPSPSKIYQNTIRFNCLWNKENNRNNNNFNIESINFNKYKQFSKTSLNYSLLDELNILKKKLNKDTNKKVNKPEIEDNLLSSKEDKKFNGK
jgi:hypothetical protein